MTKNKGIKFILLVLVIIISLYVLIQKYDIAEIVKALKNFQPIFLLYALISLALFFLLEAIGLRYLFRLFGCEPTLTRCYGYSLVDYFFSSLTPGGSGGQPSQLYFMHRDDLPVGVSGMTLLLFNMIYHVAMLVMATIAFVVGATSLVSSVGLLRYLIIYGALAQFVIVIFFLGLTLSKTMVPNLVKNVVHFLAKLRIVRQEERLLESLDIHIREYRACARLIRKRPVALLSLLVLSFFLLCSSYAIPYFVYRGLGFQDIGLFEMILVQSVIILAMESLPLPGGVGVSESSLLAVYGLIIGRAQAFPMMLLSRALSFYLGFVSGGIISFIMEKNPKKIKRRRGVMQSP